MNDTVYLFIRVVIETTFPNIHDAIQELQTETVYYIGSTQNVKVLETKIMDLKTKN